MDQPKDVPPTSDGLGHTEGLKLDLTGEEEADKTLANIEMAGEEVAAGWEPKPHEPLSPEVRYLHVSRTIHQLITDRNRSVGIFLFFTSVLFGASTALLNVPERVKPIVPLDSLQYWCLPATFSTLAVVGAFMSLILIRARIGLIYEVAKMNALLGLPSERVKRVNPLSIFFLMHTLVVLLGGISAGLTVGMLAVGGAELSSSVFWLLVLVVGVLYLALFQASYYLTILRATTETKLAQAKG